MKYLDVLTGLTIVMVLLSPLVAGITHVLLWLIGERSARLQVALENLIRLAARLSAEEARSLARSVLLHPVVGRPAFLLCRSRPGDVVSRDELTRILSELAEEADTDVKRRLAELLKSGEVVSRINAWFDPAMERTSGEYRFRAQLVTVLSAGLVASLVQLDSIDLLKRLLTDEALRDSLVKQAPPGLVPGVLPDHFVWQPLPRARLMRNPDWAVPFSRRLELVTGAGVYSLEPLWTADPLSDIESAIRNSSAPVLLERDSRRHAIVRGAGVEKLSGATIRTGLAQAQICRPVRPGEYFLIAGYRPPVPIQVEMASDFRTAVEASTAAVSTEHWPLLTALDRDTRWIEIRSRSEDPSTNILGPVSFPESLAEIDDAAFPGLRLDAEIARLKKAGFRVSDEKIDSLVLTAERLGPLQLRSIPGRPESNMLNAAPELSGGIDWQLLRRTWPGLVLTWVLLSLGAPFWYDLLKDLLKLRSSVAQKEESARIERGNDRGNDRQEAA